MNAYKTPRALEMAVKEAAKASPMDTNRAISGFYFHRFLCRVFSAPDSPYVLKGGHAMLARTIDARYTKDIDLVTSRLNIEEAIEELKGLASVDLGDFLAFSFEGAESLSALFYNRVLAGDYSGWKWSPEKLNWEATSNDRPAGSQMVPKS